MGGTKCGGSPHLPASVLLSPGQYTDSDWILHWWAKSDLGSLPVSQNQSIAGVGLAPVYLTPKPMPFLLAYAVEHVDFCLEVQVF